MLDLKEDIFFRKIGVSLPKSNFSFQIFLILQFHFSVFCQSIIACVEIPFILINFYSYDVTGIRN